MRDVLRKPSTHEHRRRPLLSCGCRLTGNPPALYIGRSIRIHYPHYRILLRLSKRSKRLTLIFGLRLRLILHHRGPQSHISCEGLPAIRSTLPCRYRRGYHSRLRRYESSSNFLFSCMSSSIYYPVNHPRCLLF